MPLTYSQMTPRRKLGRDMYKTKYKKKKIQKLLGVPYTASRTCAEFQTIL